MNPNQQPTMPPTAPAPTSPQPQMQMPTPQAMGPTPVQMGGGKKMGMNMVIGIIAAVLVVGGAIAYGVYAYVSNTPDNLLQSAISNTANRQILSATFKATGGTDANGITFSGDIALKVDPSNNKNFDAIVGFGSGDKRVVLNALGLSSDTYLKLTNAENLGSLIASYSGDSSGELSSPGLATALKNLDGQWFQLSQSDVKSIAASSGNDVSGAPSPEDVKKALTIYNQHPFIKADKAYADEKIGGSNSAHFTVKVDTAAEVTFLQAMKDANLSTMPVTDADITQAKNSSSASKDVSIDVWIARDTRQFTQVKLTNTAKGQESSIVMTSSSTNPTFDAFQKPSNVKPISDFTTTLLGPSLDGSTF